MELKALAGYSPTEFLVSTASTLLVVYLSLGYLVLQNPCTVTISLKKEGKVYLPDYE